MFKKKPVFFPLFFALILLFSFITPVFAAEDSGLDPSVDLSDTAFDSAQQEEFNELVGNDEDTIESVIIAAQHKGKDVSFEGVHADKCIKLYGLKNSGYALGALCDAYSETGRIQSMISEDYSVLTLYVNEDGQYIDSFVFVKSENYPEEHDINGWIAFGSGSLFADDTFMEEFLQEGSFENCLKGLGLNNTKNLKVISFLPNLSRCFYFEQEGEEFLIPMQDAGLAEIKAFQVYRAGDIAENFWQPIFDYEMEAAEKFKEVFGIYATELWAMPEKEFLNWLNTEHPDIKIGKWDFIGDNLFRCTNCGAVYLSDTLERLRQKLDDPIFPRFCPDCGEKKQVEEPDD